MPPPPPYLQDAPTHTHFGNSTEKILPPENSTRAGLLDEIQTFKGHDLKHVEIDEHVSDRGGLLSQIRKGTILRHVSFCLFLFFISQHSFQNIFLNKNINISNKNIRTRHF
jgi:hypothetical protein